MEIIQVVDGDQHGHLCKRATIGTLADILLPQVLRVREPLVAVACRAT